MSVSTKSRPLSALDEAVLAAINRRGRSDLWRMAHDLGYSPVREIRARLRLSVERLRRRRLVYRTDSGALVPYGGAAHRRDLEFRSRWAQLEWRHAWEALVRAHGEIERVNAEMAALD